jgi:hypothetical protein
MIESAMNSALTSIRDHLGVSAKKGLLTRLVDALEALFDVSAAIKRRRTSRRIYKDLIKERISHDRAALELKKLNRSQTGGWLLAKENSRNS